MEAKIKEVIKNNRKWPIIIENIEAENIDNAIIINSKISNKDLGIIPNENGNKMPTWILEMILNDKKNVVSTLVISDIDQIDMIEQEKFIGILKFKGINGYSFPAGTSIVLTCRKGNYDLVSPKIKDLCIKIKG